MNLRTRLAYLNPLRVHGTLQRLVRGWMCRHSRHKWQHFTKQTTRLVFYERTCAWCGRFEIQNAGPMGDRKWALPERCFNGPVGQWEREQYDSANDGREFTPGGKQ